MMVKKERVSKITIKKRKEESMKKHVSQAPWRLSLAVLGLALSVSLLATASVWAAGKKPSSPQPQEAASGHDPLDREAAARKPEMRKTVDTIQAALEAAYQNNTEIKELQAQARSTDEKVPQALAGWRPTVYANASVGGQRDFYSGNKKTDGDNSISGDSPRSGLNASTATADITVKQNLFNGGKTLASTNQAENMVQAARAQLADKEREVLMGAVQAYFTVVAKTAELEYRKNNETALRKTLEATQDKFKVGEETRTSIAQAEANLASGIADRQATEAQLLAAEATFEKITGSHPGKLRKPGDPTGMPRALKEAIEIAEKNNPAIIAALFQEKAARDEIKANDADLLPKVDLQGSIGRTSYLSRTRLTSGGTVTNHDLSTTQKVSVNLAVPLYEGGAIRGKTRELRETAEQRRIKIETERRKVVQQLVEAWENYLSAKANVKSYEAQVKANEVSLEGTRQEMLVGSKILLDVLNAQRELVNSQMNLVRAEQRYYESAYTVLATMGRMNAMDMKLKVKRYDPQVHYQDVRNSW